MKRIFISLYCLVALSGFVEAQNSSFSENRLSDSGQKAFRVLLTANRFEDTYIGYGGELSKYVAAYRVLLAEQMRTEAFRELLQRASTAGQLYALAGLYDADNVYFQSVAAKYKDSASEVDTMSGCIIAKRTVGEIVFLDQPYTVRLETPLQPFHEWKRKAKIPPDRGFMIDILGGGYSLMFRGHDL